MDRDKRVNGRTTPKGSPPGTRGTGCDLRGHLMMPAWATRLCRSGAALRASGTHNVTVVVGRFTAPPTQADASSAGTARPVVVVRFP